MNTDNQETTIVNNLREFVIKFAESGYTVFIDKKDYTQAYEAIDKYSKFFMKEYEICKILHLHFLDEQMVKSSDPNQSIFILEKIEKVVNLLYKYLKKLKDNLDESDEKNKTIKVEVETDHNEIKEQVVKQVITKLEEKSSKESTDSYMFKTKTELYDKFPMFEKVLKIITLTHDFGNYKYSPYSFQNDPENSYSTVRHSAGSLHRHFIYHKTGNLYDPESGISHIGHIACRCQMLLVPYYRNINPSYFKRDLVFCRDKCNDFFKKINHPLIEDKTSLTDQLTPEIIISTMKFDPKLFTFDTVNDVSILLQHTLYTLLKNIDDIPEDKDIFNTIYPVDVIWWCSAFLYNKFLEDHNPIIDISAGTGIIKHRLSHDPTFSINYYK